MAQQAGTTRYVYDDNGRLRAVIAPNGEAGIYEYDAAGNLKNIRRNTANQLEILDFSPRQGVPGTTVKIIGTGFGAGVTRVTFNGTAATSFTTAAPQITVTLPTGATTGPIVVTTAGGTATSAQPFTVLTSTPTPGTVQGTVRNASNSAALAGVTISIAGSTLTTTSNNAGAYTLANVPPGVRTLNASAPGFANTQLTINVISGQTITQNISLSTTLLTGELRITLNWTRDANGAPGDLDAHLYGPTTNNRCFEVYYSNKGNQNSAPFATLEVDNRSSGPPTETIHIYQTMAGTYRFFIHNYSGELADGLSRSRAIVQVYDSSGLLRTYVVPSGTGEYWHVFELNGQTRALTDINRLSDAEPPFTCGNGTN